MIRDKQRTVNLFTHLRLARTLMLTIALSTLFLSYISALATIGASEVNFDLRNLFDVDTLHPWLTFQHTFLKDDFPPDGWRHGVTFFYVPDYLILWSLFALGLDFRSAMLITPLLFAVLSIGGWIFTCDVLFGKNWQRKIAIIFLHTLPYVFAAFGSVDLFSLQFQVVYHYGTWILVPWLLGLFLRAIKSPVNSRQQWIYLLIAMILVAAATASDLLIIFWLLVPMLIALMLTAWRRHFSYLATLPFWITGLGGMIIGTLLTPILNINPHPNTGNYLSLNIENSIIVMERILSTFGEAITRAPTEAVVWAIFTAIALRRCWDATRLPDHDASAGKHSSLWHALIKIPDSPTHLFLAFFVPLAAALPIVATIATGNFVVTHPASSYNLGLVGMRYFMPFIYLPLFIGWVLLPWDIKLARKTLLLPVATIVTLMLATIKLSFSAEGLTRLDPFATSFSQCFTATAKRLGWHGGISSINFTKFFLAHPTAGIEKILPVAVLRAQTPGQSGLFLDWLTVNRHWFDGEFQFVVANKLNDHWWFEYPPTSGPPPQLPAGTWRPQLHIDDTAIRGAFGEPTAIINCNGIGLYHYDPPLHFDFSILPNPNFVQIGQRF